MKKLTLEYILENRDRYLTLQDSDVARQGEILVAPSPYIGGALFNLTDWYTGVQGEKPFRVKRDPEDTWSVMITGVDSVPLNGLGGPRGSNNWYPRRFVIVPDGHVQLELF